MTKKVKKVASSRGAIWVTEPPVSRERAGEEFGTEIPQDVWQEICGEFEKYGRNTAQNDVTTLNKNPNDPKGWRTRINNTQRSISTAISAIDAIDRNFLFEILENYEQQEKNHVASLDWNSKISRILDELLILSAISFSVQPIEREVMTKAQCCRMLAHNIFQVLQPLGAKLSNGWKVGQNPPSYAEMSGFEKLIELLEIHQGETTRATVKWIAEAVSQK